jgi:hypothetical protein
VRYANADVWPAAINHRFACYDNRDLNGEVALKLSVGHLLLVWEVLANKLAGSPVLETYGEEERRAIWALQDLCENALQAYGVVPRPKADWDRLLQAARDHVKHIPVEYGDSDPPSLGSGVPTPEIASRTIVAEDAAGRKFEITVRIGSPVQLDEDEWECAVAVDGLHEDLRPQHGIDSWQVLMLAQNLARMLLKYFVEDGGTLHGKNSNEPIDLLTFFGNGTGV